MKTDRVVAETKSESEL